MNYSWKCMVICKNLLIIIGGNLKPVNGALMNLSRSTGDFHWMISFYTHKIHLHVFWASYRAVNTSTCKWYFNIIMPPPWNGLICYVFMPPPTKWPEALCFRVVRPSVRTYVCPSVRPSVPFCLCWYLKNREAVLHQTWYEGISWGDDTLGGF